MNQKDPMTNKGKDLTKEDMQALITSMDFARWEHPIVMKCFHLLRQLNNWLGSCYSKEHRPHAHISIAAFGVCVLVNDICLWDSENNDESELTLDFCKEQLKEHAMYFMTPFE